MANPQASDILGRVTLVTGPEEFLNQRTVSAALGAVRAADPESEVSETSADQLTMASLGDLAAPSLFSSVRCVVVRGLENLSDDVHAGLLEYAESVEGCISQRRFGSDEYIRRRADSIRAHAAELLNGLPYE